MYQRLIYLTFVALGASIAPASHAQTARPLVKVEASRLADTAHLEFRGLKSWTYELRPDGKGVTNLTVPPLDRASVDRLRAFTDPLVKAVRVNESGPDGNFVVSVEVAGGDVESFDYQTDEPSRLIVDFYRKADTAEPAKAAAPKVAAKPARKKRPARALASDEFPKTVASADGLKADAGPRLGLFDGGDENYDRFRIKDYEMREDAVIASRQGIYLPFPALRGKVSRLSDLNAQPPEYVIHPKDTRENKEARLLQALFERKRFAVFRKTFDYFTKKYPESVYTEILKNMLAQVNLDEWRETKKPADYDRAVASFQQLVDEYPKSPLAERNFQILAYARLDRGEALQTLQTFQALIDAYPKSPEVPQAHKAMAEAYLILRKYDDATAEYQQIIKDFPGTEDAREARYRLGDVHFARGDYSPAIRLFETAIKELPGQEKTYPNADFNMAEARFWQKDYRRALNDYIQFVTLNPAHEYGGYALTRIGEILQILGADQRRSMGAFLEAYFRFPDHPGAKIARIRMLSQQMRGMKPNEVKRTMVEIGELSKQIDIAGAAEFAVLMESEGLTNRGEFTNAIDALIAHYQKNPTHLPMIKARVVRNIASELKDRVAREKYLSALEFYAKYEKNWLTDEDRIDVPYFVAAAYEGAGDFKEAEQIYRRVLQKRERIVGTVDEKERRVREHLPSVASLHLRLAASLAQDREYIEAYRQLKAIDKAAELAPPEVIERVRLNALIAEQRNEPDRAREALVDLAKRWKGDAALLAPVNLQLAQTFLKLKNPAQAETYADRALAAEGGETKIDDRVLSAGLKAKGDAQLAGGRAMAAVETYQRQLQRFEESQPLAAVRYQVGQILFDRGDRKGATEVWRRLEGTSGEFLGKVGAEKLKDAQWKDEYNKYISRIPAMADRQKALSEPTEKR